MMQISPSARNRVLRYEISVARPGGVEITHVPDLLLQIVFLQKSNYQLSAASVTEMRAKITYEDARRAGQ